MRIWWSSFFLLLTLSPSIIGISEVLEHWDHHHATLCHEEDTHMHPLEHHCSVDSGWMWAMDEPTFAFSFEVPEVFLEAPATGHVPTRLIGRFEWNSGRAPPYVG